MMELQGQREICPAHDLCASKACNQPLAGLPALAYKDESTGEVYLMHVMCAPFPLRKAYHEATANG